MEKIDLMNRYYISSGGARVDGPYTESQVRSMWAAGSLLADAQICTEGVEYWRSLVDFIGEREDVEAAPIAREQSLYHRPAPLPVVQVPDKKSSGIGCWGWAVLGVIAPCAALPWLVFLLSKGEPSKAREARSSTYEAEPDYAIEKWIKISIADPEAKITARTSPFKTWDGVRLVAGDVQARNAFGGWVRNRYAFVWDGEANAIGVPIEQLIEDFAKGVNTSGTQEESEGKGKALAKLREWQALIQLSKTD